MVTVGPLVTYYPTVAQAEKAITDAGYQRNNQRAIWINAEGKTAKVMREAPNKFYVQWGS